MTINDLFCFDLISEYIYKLVFGPRAPTLCSGDIYWAKLFWTSCDVKCGKHQKNTFNNGFFSGQPTRAKTTLT